MIRIAVDAMGGDFAPEAVLAGAALAKDHYQITLVGPDFLQEKVPTGVNFVEAPQWIEMGENPATALRRKRGSSILTAAKLVQVGTADAFISAGNSGATMGAALLGIGRLKGITRPAIAIPLPTIHDYPCLVLDAGANVDPSPENLLQFAQMGVSYYAAVFGKVEPKVGLLNIGEEENKGNHLTLEAYKLLAASDLNFTGNVEGQDLTSGTVDVVICDGFTGNIVLKFAEGLAASILKIMKEEVKKSWFSKMGMALVKPALKSMMARFDYAEYGGAPLLGVEGVVMISHGKSDAKAIFNAIKSAAACVEHNVIQQLKEVQ